MASEQEEGEITSDPEPRGETGSRRITHLPNSIPQESVLATVEPLDVRGRVYIAQQPTLDNDYQLIVTFDDDSQGGAAWYEAYLFSDLFRFRVRAYIDGVSNLVLQGDSAHWENMKWAVPGRHEGQNLPTVIDDVEWRPDWSAQEGEAVTTQSLSSFPDFQ